MMKKYALFGLIMVLAVSIAAVGCGSKKTTHIVTPTATQVVSTPTSEATEEPTATQETNEAVTATSLDFTIEYVLEGQGTFTYQYRARNIGTNDLDFRVDMSAPQMNAIYILKGSTHQGWVYSGGQWFEFTTMYQNWDEFWDAWYESFEDYHDALVEDWTGVEGWTYTVPGVGTVTYTNVDINPSLPDSVFQPD